MKIPLKISEMERDSHLHLVRWNATFIPIGEMDGDSAFFSIFKIPRVRTQLIFKQILSKIKQIYTFLIDFENSAGTHSTNFLGNLYKFTHFEDFENSAGTS